MNTSTRREIAVAVMGGYSNYTDVHRELERWGLVARHVIRPSYRDSFRWLRHHINNDTLNPLLPLLFVFDTEESMLAYNMTAVHQGLQRLGLTF